MPDAKHPKILIDGKELLDAFGSPRLLADKLTLELAPQFCVFEMTAYYGEFSRGGKFVDHPPLDLSGRTVDVWMDKNLLFSGIVQRVADYPDGTRPGIDGDIRSGICKYAAYSFDYLLDRIYVDKTFFKDFSTTKIFAFNEVNGQHGQNCDASGPCFNLTFGKLYSGMFWTSERILLYLLNRFTTETGFSWSLTGDIAALSTVQPSFSPSGKTIRECISEVLRPASGYSWFVRRGSGEKHLELVVVSFSDVTMTYLVANGRRFEVQSGIEKSQLATEVSITAVEDSAYHEIRVVGEPIRVMATLSLKDAFEKGWSKNLETNYWLDNDYNRSKPLYNDVWQYYRIKKSWDQTDYKKRPLAPKMNEETGEITYEPRTGVAVLYVFERSLPRIASYGNGGTAEWRGTYEKPQLLASLESGKTDKLHDITKSTELAEVGFAFLDNSAGIRLNGPYNHVCAKEYFMDYTSDFSSLYNPDDIYLTVSWKTDTLLALRRQALPRKAGESLRVKEIYVRGAAYEAAPAPYRTGDAISAEYIENTFRDDRNFLRQIMATATAWYGRKRNLLSYNWGDITEINRLGMMVARIYSGGAFIPGGTVISRQVYDFEKQIVSLRSDFSGVDFAKMFALGRGRANFDTDRLSILDARTQQIPVAPGARGKEYAGQFKAVLITGDGKNQITFTHVGGTDRKKCGFIDLVGWIDKPTLELQIGTVYVIVEWVAGKYQARFDWQLPTETDDRFVYRQLASVYKQEDRWMATQLYLDGGEIRFKGEVYT